MYIIFGDLDKAFDQVLILIRQPRDLRTAGFSKFPDY